MSLGPVQFIAYGFETVDRFRGEILDELERLEGRGTIRVLDLLFVAKDEQGDLVVFELDDGAEEAPDEGESMEVGAALARLLGFEVEPSGAAESSAPVDGGGWGGLVAEQIEQMTSDLAPGSALGLLLVEHLWASRFRGAVQRAGGTPLLQGFLGPDLLALVGAEALATVAMESALEAAAVLEAEAVLRSLEALAAIEEADAVVAAVGAGRAVRALVDADLLQEAEAADALAVLADAGIVPADTYQAAVESTTGG